MLGLLAQGAWGLPGVTEPGPDSQGKGGGAGVRASGAAGGGVGSTCVFCLQGRAVGAGARAGDLCLSRWGPGFIPGLREATR